MRRDFSIAWAAAASEGWLYRETVFPPGTLWIAGSGHVAQAVAPLAVQLDFEVTVFDDRPAFASAFVSSPKTPAWTSISMNRLTTSAF